MTEFDLIERIRARSRTRCARGGVILGIGDDAALLNMPVGQVLAVTTDTLVAGVHFPFDTAPADIGWKALAVNLSDLAAMAAAPAWASLALTLPEADCVWLDSFLDGFFELAQQHDVALIGGDLTHGPLSITITLHGFVPAADALRRDTAKAGDDIWVTGTLGDAAGGLVQWRHKKLISAKLRHRLDRPTPRVDVGLALRGLARSAIDISDGLVADVGHILRGSGVGAEIDLVRLPTSRTLMEHFGNDEERWSLQLTGGDDYELCFTAPPAHALAIEKALAVCGCSAVVIGRICSGSGLRLLTSDGEEFALTRSGYRHFDGG